MTKLPEYSKEEKILLQQLRSSQDPELTWEGIAILFNDRLREGRPARSSGGLKAKWTRMKRDRREAERQNAIPDYPASTVEYNGNSGGYQIQVC